jgi:hypothetical protein
MTKNVLYNSIIAICYSLIQLPLYLADWPGRQNLGENIFVNPSNSFYVQITLFIIHIVVLLIVVSKDILNEDYSKAWKDIVIICIVSILAVGAFLLSYLLIFLNSPFDG